MARASGDWICWLNADDELAPGAIAAFQRTLKRRPDADVIYGHVQFIDEESRPLWVCYHLPYFYGLTLYGCYAPPSTGTFFRRDLLLREPLDLDYHYVMDSEWFLRCGGKIKAVLVDEVFCRFRISGGSKTGTNITVGEVKPRHAEEREMYRRAHIYRRWPGLTEEQARARLVRRRKGWMLLYNFLKLRYAWRYLAQAMAKC